MLSYRTSVALAATPARLQGFAARTLEFLQMVERTVQDATAEAATLRAWSASLRDALARVASQPDGRPVLDPDGRAAELFGMAAKILEERHAQALTAKADALADTDLRAGDGVAEAFGDLADALAEHHDVVQDLMDTIATMDALLEPSVGTPLRSEQDVRDWIASL